MPLVCVISIPEIYQAIDNGNTLRFYLSVLTNPDQINALRYRDDIAESLKAELSHALLVQVEWGASPQGDIQVAVSDIYILSGVVNVTVTAGPRDPSLEAVASFSSAFAIIAIPRSALDVSQPITFNVINKGQVVASEAWQPQ